MLERAERRAERELDADETHGVRRLPAHGELIPIEYRWAGRHT